MKATPRKSPQSLRLDDDTRLALEALATQTDQTMSQIIRRCLREGLRALRGSRALRDGRDHDRGY